MRRAVERIIEKDGVDVVIHTHGTSYRSRVLLQLVASKSWQNMERMIESGGEMLRGQYLLLCPGGIPIQASDTLEVNGRTFILRRVEPFLYRRRVLFHWGLCVEGGTFES